MNMLLFKAYKQNTVTNMHFKICVENILTKYIAEIINFVIWGDVNINMLKSKTCLDDLFDVYGVKYIENSPTYSKGKVPTMIDLVLTKVSKNIKNRYCVPYDLSDVHGAVCFATNLKAPVRKEKACCVS